MSFICEEKEAARLSVFVRIFNMTQHEEPPTAMENPACRTTPVQAATRLMETPTRRTTSGQLAEAPTRRTKRTYMYPVPMQILYRISYKLTTWDRCQCVFAVELHQFSACCPPVVISATARTVQILRDDARSAGRQLLEHFVYLWDFHWVYTFSSIKLIKCIWIVFLVNLYRINGVNTYKA